MQVQVADVGPYVSRVRQSDLSVHVRTVHIDLSAVVVHDVDDLADAALEHAVRRRIGNHDAAKLAGVLRGFGFQVVDVDVAALVAGHGHRPHTGHRGRGGIRAVSRGRYQRDVPIALPATLVIGSDHHQARIFARRARIGLQRHGRHARDRRQVLRQRVDQLAVALGLIGRNERVNIGELTQAQRHHRNGGRQLHRARAERDHAVDQRDVAPLELLDVAHQFGLAAIVAEYRLGQIGRRAAHPDRKTVLPPDRLERRSFLARRLGERGDHGIRLGKRRKLVERQPHAALVGIKEVQPAGERGLAHFRRIGSHLDRIEEVFGFQLVAQFFEHIGHDDGMTVGMQGDPTDALGSVIDGEEAGHRSQQRLSRTDIRRGPLALDVLLAHLKRHAQRFVAEPIDRNADDPAGHISLESVLRGQIGRMRAAESHRNAETLRRTGHDVGAPLARRLQQRKAQHVGHGRHQHAPTVGRRSEIVVVAHLAVGRRILYDRAELAARELVAVEAVADDLDAERLAAGQQHVERLRENILIDEQHVASLADRLARTEREHHRHSLGRSGRLVEQRAIAHLHARHRDDGGLEIQQRFQTPLRDFGLIGRIGGIPGGVLEHVAQDDRRRGRAVIPHTD